MSSATIIDQFVVKLGLDPKDFTKGEKEAAGAVLDLEKTTKKAGEGIGKGLEGAAKSFGNSGGMIAKIAGRGGAVGIAIALLIAAGKKVNDMLYTVAENTREVGLDAVAFDTSASGLRNMGNAAELAGGQVEDAAKTVGGLQKSLFDLRFNGQISENLVMLTRLGVQFTDAYGRARDFKDVTLDTAAALERAQKQGTMSKGEAFFAAQQAGFTGGMARLVVEGRASVATALARQEARRQVSAGDIDAANQWVTSSISKGQAAEANVGVPLMQRDAALNAGANRGIEGMITGGSGMLASASDKASIALGDLADNAKKAGASFGSAMGAQGAWFRGKYVYGPTLDAAADKYGIDRSVMHGIARTESGYSADAEAKDINGNVTGRGIMQLNPKYFPNAGKNPYDDIDTAAKHFSGLLGRTEGTEPERYTQALRMYNAGETNYRNGTNLGPQNRAYAGKVLQGTPFSAMPTPGAQAGGTNTNSNTRVDIDTINIQTRATDAQGIAGSLDDAVKRKLMVSQAETGMN